MVRRVHRSAARSNARTLGRPWLTASAASGVGRAHGTIRIGDATYEPLPFTLPQLASGHRPRQLAGGELQGNVVSLELLALSRRRSSCRCRDAAKIDRTRRATLTR